MPKNKTRLSTEGGGVPKTIQGGLRQRGGDRGGAGGGGEKEEEEENEQKDKI